jgi:glutamate carboxypeptidase
VADVARRSEAPSPTGLRAELEARREAMVADLRDFVSIESPSLDAARLTESARWLAACMERVLGRPARVVESPRGPHVHWRGSDHTRVLIVGHHDTVFPAGTLAQRPFTLEGDVARGPGVFDMKAGIIQALHGLARVPEWYHAEILITADEEVGSEASRALLEERARATGAVLVLEPSADGGALKVARKGTGTYRVHVGGRAAHAGLEPEKGVNALVEMSAQVGAIAAIGRPEAGTTVTPTVARAGTADNVVPESAEIAVDVRCTAPEERERIERVMQGLRPTLAGATLRIEGGMNRPPLPESATRELYALARDVARELGMGELDGVAVGGGSDGNLTAAVGVRTLDGLGAVGGGAHAVTEHVRVDRMAERAALVAGLTRAIVNAR